MEKRNVEYDGGRKGTEKYDIVKCLKKNVHIYTYNKET